MAAVLTGRGENTQRCRIEEDGNRDWSGAPIKTRKGRIARSHQNSEEARTDPPLDPSKGAEPCRHLDCKLLDRRL